MGAASSTRRLTVDCIALLEMLEPNVAEAQKKVDVRDRVQMRLAQEWPTCRVVPFGSSESGLGFGGSDLDLAIYFEDECQNPLTTQERIDILTRGCARLGDAFEIVEFVQHARVPVVKMWDPQTQIACDLCVGSIHVLLNTALLKHYAQLDPRVRPLAFAVKTWAKQRGINDSVNGTLSSYGFILLLIFYLQSCHAQSLLSPVPSVFYSLLAEKSIASVLRQLESLSLEARRATFGTSIAESVGALLVGFFRFYATEFNYEQDVVSIRTGMPITKAVKWNRPVPWRISIEDPFEQLHDIGRVIFSARAQELLRVEFGRAFEMLSRGSRLEDICARDETVWNWNVSCYICNGVDHGARECAQMAQRLDRNKTGATSANHRQPQGSAVDCWYCGEVGHVKATCPQYAFLTIPNPAVAVSKPALPSFPSTPLSAPVPIPVPRLSPLQDVFKTTTLWDSDTRSQLSSPRRVGKKKRRRRHGSISSASSSPEQERSRKYMLAAAQLCTSSRRCGREDHGAAYKYDAEDTVMQEISCQV